MISPNWTRRIAAVGVLALAVSACGGDAPGSTGDTDSNTSDTTADTTSGDTLDTSSWSAVRVDGSSTVGPLAEVAAQLFMQAHDGARVDVAMSGTSGGFQQFCIGEGDMNNASRPIKDSEIELCADHDIAWDGVQVSNDALSLVVNPANPVDCLTVSQASQIWDEGSTVSTWGEVDGLDLDDFASTSLQPVGPGHDSGTFDFFTEVINGAEGQIRSDYTDIGEDDDLAVETVKGDVGAIGYIPYSYFQEAGDAVKALQVDGGNGCVDGTLDNVQNGSYTPLGRPLFTYASDLALSRAEVLAFMEFWINESDQIATIAGFVPMTEAQKAESLAKVMALTS